MFHSVPTPTLDEIERATGAKDVYCSRARP